MRPLLARASRLIAVAAFEIDLFSRALRVSRDRFALVPNGADFGDGAPPEPEATDPTLIASIGRLERYKGHHRVIAALPHVLEHEPSARLWIAGLGPYEPELRRAACGLGVEERVEIRAVPADHRDRMRREMSRVGVVVLMSEFETHPLAALEAVALRRRLVVARTSGLAEIEREGWGRGVPLGADPKTLARAIVAAIREPFEPAPLSSYSWDHCAARLEELYLSVLSA